MRITETAWYGCVGRLLSLLVVGHPAALSAQPAAPSPPPTVASPAPAPSAPPTAPVAPTQTESPTTLPTSPAVLTPAPVSPVLPQAPRAGNAAEAASPASSANQSTPIGAQTGAAATPAASGASGGAASVTPNAPPVTLPPTEAIGLANVDSVQTSAVPTSNVPKASASSASDPKAPSDAELAAELALLGMSANNSAPDKGSVLSNLGFYGFADFMFNKSLDTEVNSVLWPYDSFSVGNLNLYWGGSLGSNWQTLAEVRFTYLPHGASTFAPGGMSRTNTTVGDYNDYDRPLRWGGIEIERVWVEYVAHSLLTLRFGQWLTPYGIWNVDHGSPVIIGVVRPFVIGEQLFPERQTGIELYGAWQFEKSELSYHLTLSNGRGALDAYKDLDDNKAIGARVQWRGDDDWGRLALGGSFYHGRHTDSIQAFVPNDSGGFERTFDVTEQYDETGLALDLKFELEGYLLQGEVLVQDKVFSSNNRPAAMAIDGGPFGFSSDERRWGTYVLTGYRTPWFGVMPFAGVEYYSSDNAFSNPAIATFLGINARVAASVVLKAQWTHSWFPNLEARIAPPADNLFLQIAWSF